MGEPAKARGEVDAVDLDEEGLAHDLEVVTEYGRWLGQTLARGADPSQPHPRRVAAVLGLGRLAAAGRVCLLEDRPEDAGVGVSATESPLSFGPSLALVGAPSRPVSQGLPKSGSLPPPDHVNHVAESQVIAAALAENALIDEWTWLEAKHFGGVGRSALWLTMRQLRLEGVPFDAAVLGHELAERGRLTEAGGSATLSYYAELAKLPASPLVGRQAEIVRDDAERRSLLYDLNGLTRDPARLDVGRARAILERLGPRDEWEAPEVDEQGLAVAAFPVEAVPRGLAEFAVETALSVPCPLDFVMVPALAVAATALGRSTAVRIKPGWDEEANLWTAIVGAPGTAKSPALRAALAPLFRLQREALYEHETLREAAKKEKRRAKRRGREAGMLPLEDVEDVPPPRRCLIDDVTTEALCQKLAQNERGMLLACDELSGWVNGMNQYKSGGNDLQVFLKLWTRSTVIVDRKGQDGGVPIYASDPFLAITGGIQPDLLFGFRTGKDDGFIDRILFAFPAPLRTRFVRTSASAESKEAWTSAVRRLWELDLVAGDFGERRPKVLAFDPPAFERFAAHFDALCEATEADDFPETLKGPHSKLRAYTARLALLVEMLGWAFSVPARSKASSLPRAVSLASLEAAIALVDYFLAHYRRVLRYLAGDAGTNHDADAILHWLQRRKPEPGSDRPSGVVPLSTIRDNFRRRFEARPEALAKALEWLIARKLIKPIEAGPSPRGGRARGASYAVNPAVYQLPVLPRARANAPNPGPALPDSDLGRN